MKCVSVEVLKKRKRKEDIRRTRHFILPKYCSRPTSSPNPPPAPLWDAASNTTMFFVNLVVLPN